MVESMRVHVSLAIDNSIGQTGDITSIAQASTVVPVAWPNPALQNIGILTAIGHVSILKNNAPSVNSLEVHLLANNKPVVNITLHKYSNGTFIGPA